MTNIRDDDKLLVNRSSTSFSVSASDLMTNVRDSDFLLVNRGVASYKTTAEDFKEYLNPTLPLPAGASDVIVDADGVAANPQVVTLKSDTNTGTLYGNNVKMVTVSGDDISDASYVPVTNTITNVDAVDDSQTVAWSRTDVSPDGRIVYEDNDHIISTPLGSKANCRATEYITDGKFYFEYKILAMNGGVDIAFMDYDVPLGTEGVGTSDDLKKHGVTVTNNGTVFVFGTEYNRILPGYGAGDTVRMALDTEAGTVNIAINDTSFKEFWDSQLRLVGIKAIPAVYINGGKVDGLFDDETNFPILDGYEPISNHGAVLTFADPSPDLKFFQPGDVVQSEVLTQEILWDPSVPCYVHDPANPNVVTNSSTNLGALSQTSVPQNSKVYFEIESLGTHTTDHYVGMVQAGTTCSAYSVGWQAPDGWSTRSKALGNGVEGTGADRTTNPDWGDTGSVLMVACDMSNGKIYLGADGVWTRTPDVDAPCVNNPNITVHDYLIHCRAFTADGSLRLNDVNKYPIPDGYSPIDAIVIEGTETKVISRDPVARTMVVDGGNWLGSDGTNSGDAANQETIVTGPSKSGTGILNTRNNPVVNIAFSNGQWIDNTNSNSGADHSGASAKEFHLGIDGGFNRHRIELLAVSRATEWQPNTGYEAYSFVKYDGRYWYAVSSSYNNAPDANDPEDWYDLGTIV